MDRQKQCAGRVSAEMRNLVVGNHGDTVHNPAVLVEVDQIVRRHRRHGGNAFERIQPEASLRVWAQPFNQGFDPFQGIGLGVDDGDAGAHEVFPGLVVHAEFLGLHGALVQVQTAGSRGMPEVLLDAIRLWQPDNTQTSGHHDRQGSETCKKLKGEEQRQAEERPSAGQGRHFEPRYRWDAKS